jgi:hypothetical protein
MACFLRRRDPIVHVRLAVLKPPTSMTSTRCLRRTDAHLRMSIRIDTYTKGRTIRRGGMHGVVEQILARKNIEWEG